MPNREQVAQVGDIPWEWLHADAAGYFPRSPAVMEREHNLRFHHLPDEPMWPAMIQEFSSQAVWQFVCDGGRELLVDGSYHDEIYRSVNARVRELTGEYTFGFDFIHTSSGRPLRYSEFYFNSILQDSLSYPDATHHSFREKFVASGATLSYYLGVAMPKNVQNAMHEGTGYMRYQPYLDKLYVDTKNGLLRNYRLPEDTPALLTSKGVQTIKLVYEALADYYTSPYRIGTVTPVIIGNQYKEAQNAINSFAFRYQYPTIGDMNYDEIYRHMESDGTKALVFFIDPLENAPEMKCHDVGSLIEVVSKRAKQHNTPTYIVCDITLMAGQMDVKSLVNRIEPDSPTVFIPIESLLKYYSLGIDLSYMGSILFTGNSELISEFWPKITDMYRSWALSPGLYDMGSYPPVHAEYMKHRAGRISRNAKIIVDTLLSEFPDSTIHYSGNDPAFRPESSKGSSGFYGGMFFIDMESEKQVEEAIRAIDESLEDGRFGSIAKRDGFGYQQTTVAPFGTHVRVSVGNEDVFLAFCQALYLKNTLKKFLRAAV